MSNQNVTVQVEAKDACVSGGYGKEVAKIPSNTLLQITCKPDEYWQLDGNLRSNANGLDSYRYSKNNHTFRTGSLVGSFDEGVTFFSVGTHLQRRVTEVLPSGDDPTLRLYCWGAGKAHNSGTIKADIRLITN